ncbi:SDR family oxidoreductase [Dactylosporangium siamense]|uniref:Nucleotide-diphosphate-sugar epimerase n=1 Tax=Dactylosporangium siamense TaxID=685454 RepID=A0A919PUK8_9ACTN|nr:NAD(P)H-binding protein [Dactylosporangium siamense]GIG49566.1 nucleotide-diphosphate-sugar epimerase [Dactylosporangium siamense]
MILLTGATGTIGRHLLRILTGTGEPVRAVTRGAPLPGVDSVRAVEAGLDGATALFLHPRVAGEDAAGILASARAAGVRKVVALTAMNVEDPEERQPSRFAGDRNKELDAAARDSGLDWTVLRASSFAGNAARAFGPQLRAGHVVRYPFRAFQESLVDERDIAEVAAAALRDGTLSGRVLELTGPQSLTHGEQVATIGAVLRRPLTFQEVPPAVAAWQLTVGGLPELFVGALMERYERHLDQPQHPPTGVVEEVLGRPATPFASWVADHADAF